MVTRLVAWLAVFSAVAVSGQHTAPTCEDLTSPPSTAQLYLSWSDRGVGWAQIKDHRYFPQAADGIVCDPVLFFYSDALQEHTNPTGAVFVTNDTGLEVYWSQAVDANMINVTLLPGGNISFDVSSVKRHKELHSLALRGGIMPIIPSGFFDDNTWDSTLLLLDLTGNNITHLDKDVFRNLYSLTIFIFSDNSLHQYDPGLFCNLPSLFSITMHNVFHNGFPKDLFSLESISNLTNCDVGFTYNYAYILRLSRNNFTVLSNSSMTALRNLKKIRMVGSSIKVMEPSAFAGLQRLTRLVLTDNEFEEFPPTVFAPLESLEELRTANGRIKSISGAHFHNSTSIRIIDVSNNNIASISGSFSGLTNLHEFYASANSLTSISATAFSGIEYLDYLDFSRNSIASIAGSFVGVNSGYNYPLTLDFSYNDIEELDQALFDESTPVVKLSLSHNGIKQLPESIFETQEEMKHLILRYNILGYLPCVGFTNLSKLEILDVSHNTISGLCDTIFQPLHKLEELNLAHNNIGSFPEAMLENVASLRNLRLDDNKLTELNPSLLITRSKSLTYVRLGENPWDCACQLTPLISWVRTNQDKVPDAGDMVCVSPPDLQDQPVLSAAMDTCTTEAHMPVEDDDYTVIIIALVCVFVLCVAASTVTVVFRSEIAVMIYAKFGIHVVKDPFSATSRTFDAFVSFSQHDLKFVLEELMPRLEEEAQPQYKLCVHNRDFEVGAAISENITWAIDNSQRTILLLSQHFLESEWCQYEFSKAHHNVITEGRGQLIIVMMGDIEADSVKDRELKSYLRTHTFLERKDRLFWERLRYSMPHNTVDDKSHDEVAAIVNEAFVTME